MSAEYTTERKILTIHPPRLPGRLKLGLYRPCPLRRISLPPRGPVRRRGAPDVVARRIAQRLTERLGQSVVVENKLGAGGNIASGGWRVPQSGVTAWCSRKPGSRLQHGPVEDAAVRGAERLRPRHGGRIRALHPGCEPERQRGRLGTLADECGEPRALAVTGW